MCFGCFHAEAETGLPGKRFGGKVIRTILGALRFKGMYGTGNKRQSKKVNTG